MMPTEEEMEKTLEGQFARYVIVKPHYEQDIFTTAQVLITRYLSSEGGGLTVFIPHFEVQNNVLISLLAECVVFV